MAAEISKLNQGYNRVLSYRSLLVAIAQATNQDLIELDVSGIKRIFMQFDVVGQALDEFKILAKAHPDATSWVTLYSTTAQFTAPQGVLVGASGDLTLAAVGVGYWLILDVKCFAKVKFTTSSGNVAGSTINLWGHGI